MIGPASTFDNVLGIIVSFNDGHAVKQCVDALLPQVGSILVVDNGSTERNVALINDLDRYPSVSIDWRPVNEGIAAALNLGLRRAEEENFEWILTMDQDSIPNPDMIAAYFKAREQLPPSASLAPVIRDSDSLALENGVRKVDYAITSGNLTKTTVARAVGGFDEAMFIDCVDFDFCLKLRSVGVEIYEVGSARMHHQLGDKNSLPKILSKFYTNHSPLRRYYIFRNALVLMRRYYQAFPLFCLKFLIGHLCYICTIILFGPKRLESFQMIARGFKDYFKGKSGIA